MKKKMDNMKNKMDENTEEMKINIDEMESKMDKNMDENKVEIEKSMKELQKSLSSTIFQAVDEIPPKGDIKMQGTHENKGSIWVEQPTNNKNFDSIFNYGGDPKFNLSKIELNKFDGTCKF
jgi:hypothetical protein